jgi:hypothetical protein
LARAGVGAAAINPRAATPHTADNNKERIANLLSFPWNLGSARDFPDDSPNISSLTNL